MSELKLQSYEELLMDSGYVQLQSDSHATIVPAYRDGKHVLTPHLDVRGGLVELWRRSWEDPEGLLESNDQVLQAYVSITMPGIVKAWHAHAIQTDRFVVLRGRILLATRPLDHACALQVWERVLEAGTWELVHIPPTFAHGWMALGNEPAHVLNLCSQEYTGMDEWRRDAHSGPDTMTSYEWRRNRDG
jgi:dTDP-4-dehydrorhamnose 3,5-epimerase